MKKKDTVKLPKGQIDEMQPFESWSIEEQIEYEKAQHFKMGVDYMLKLNQDSEILSLKKVKPSISGESHGYVEVEIYMDGKKERDEQIYWDFLEMIHHTAPEVLKEFIEQHYGTGIK